MSEKLEEKSPGVYKIPEEDLKRLRKNQEKRNQRAAKRKSNSRGYLGGRRRTKLSLTEMMNSEPGIRDVDEVMERRHDDRLNALEGD